jgi:DNA-binding CsgD family transcriptional regulator
MLTQRQAQILQMFLDGMTYREIAAALGLSPETINPSLKQSARRLGAPGIGREVLRAAVERHEGERIGVVSQPGDLK